MTTLTTTVQERIALPASPQRPRGEGMTPPSAAEFLGIIRRRAVLILFIFSLLSGMALGGFAIWAKYFPGYRSEALIECISNIPEAQLSVEQQRLKQDEHARFVKSQALLVKSPDVLAEALKVTAVRETKWFKSVPQGDHLLELTNELNAAPVRGTNFLRVSIECRNKKDPPLIVNEVVDQWFHSVKKRSAEIVADEALEAANQELETLDREIVEEQERRKSIVARLPPGATQTSGDTVAHQQVLNLTEIVNRLSLELSQLEQYKEVYTSKTGVLTPEDRAVVEQDPSVAQLSQDLFQLQQQRAAASKVYGVGHVVLRQLDARISATDSKLDQLRSEKLRERWADMREAAETAYDNTRHAWFEAREDLLEAEAALQDQDRLLFEYQNVEAEIERRMENRQQLIDYVNTLTRIKTQRTAIHVNIAQRAIPPLRRNTPSPFLLPVGIFMALVLSCGLAIGLEMMDKSVRTSQDILRHLDVPLLGLVPHSDDEEVDIERVETAVFDAPQSMMAEVFRRIRTNLQFSAPAERQRTVLVTSPTPEDGKTTIACNLAIVIAQGGRRVLLVDANFRRPRVSHVFPSGESRGLSNLLIGEGDLEAYVAPTDIPSLDVLKSGPIPPNPVELLGSDHCRAFLENAMARYDQIIIDAAPVLLASDTLVLGTAVDGVVLVVRANKNSRGISRRASRLLSDVGVHLFGAILNAAQVTRGGYFREQLRAYYDYHPDAKETEKDARLAAQALSRSLPSHDTNDKNDDD